EISTSCPKNEDTSDYRCFICGGIAGGRSGQCMDLRPSVSSYQPVEPAGILPHCGNGGCKAQSVWGTGAGWRTVSGLYTAAFDGCRPFGPSLLHSADDTDFLARTLPQGRKA